MSTATIEQPLEKPAAKPSLEERIERLEQMLAGGKLVLTGESGGRIVLDWSAFPHSGFPEIRLISDDGKYHTLICAKGIFACGPSGMAALEADTDPRRGPQVYTNGPTRGDGDPWTACLFANDQGGGLSMVDAVGHGRVVSVADFDSILKPPADAKTE